MRIILIKPYWPYPYSKGEDTYNRIWPPLCLANCAALLEKDGHRVAILDAHAQRIIPNRINRFIKEYDKIFITSSSLDKWQSPNIDITTFLETVRYAKKVNDEVYIMGYHGTVKPEIILELTGAMAVIRGEPEYTVLESCQKKDLSEIEGITFKENGKIISTPQRELIDLKSLPIPAYHLVNFKKYFYEILGRNFCLFEISRGCKFKCRFCNKVMYGDGLRVKSKEQVFEEVSLGIEKYKVRTGYFIDLDFLSSREIVEELCAYLIKKRYKFKWICQTRPDLLTQGILKIMKRAGCALMHLGIETGSQAVLDYFNKGISVATIKAAVNLCRDAGIQTLVFFLFGLSGENKQDRERTYKFIRELNADFISLHRVIAYQGSFLQQHQVNPERQLDKFLRYATASYYMRPCYLSKLNLYTFWAGARLFAGRMRTLK